MENKEDIKFLSWEMGRFLRHFIISFVLFSLCGIYVIVIIGGKDNYLAANGYLVFTLTIVASVLSVVSLVLSYHNTKQAQETQRHIIEKLTEISERLPTQFTKTKKDWKKGNES